MRQTCALAAVVVALIAGGCSDEPGGWVRLVNDFGQPVVVSLCTDNHCHHHVDTRVVRPGGIYEQNVSSSADVTNWVTVATQQRQRLGCVRLQFDHEVVGIRIPVSRAGRCP